MTHLTRLPLLLALALGPAACSAGISDVAPPADDTGGADTTTGDSGARDDGTDGTLLDSITGDTSTGDGAVDGGSGDATPGDVAPPDTGPSTDSGGAACGAPGDPSCGGGLNCCAGACKNFENDPLNCGGCGHLCTGEKSMCLGGGCETPTCPTTCAAGEQCCLVPGPGPSALPKCYPGITCPVGCPLCK